MSKSIEIQVTIRIKYIAQNDIDVDVGALMAHVSDEIQHKIDYSGMCEFYGTDMPNADVSVTQVV